MGFIVDNDSFVLFALSFQKKKKEKKPLRHGKMGKEWKRDCYSIDLSGFLFSIFCQWDDINISAETQANGVWFVMTLTCTQMNCEFEK